MLNKIFNVYYFSFVSLSLPIISRQSIQPLNNSLNTKLNSISFFYNLSANGCKPLERSLRKIIETDIHRWSLTALNKRGRLIADINGNFQRIPASNIKLFTTAYFLDKFGPTAKLKTQVHVTKNGLFVLTGEGDPDLNQQKLSRLVGKIVDYHRSIDSGTRKLRLLIREEPRKYWWPNDWHPADRLQPYGAPITRLAISSNFDFESVGNPQSRLISILRDEFAYQNINPHFLFTDHNNKTYHPKKLLLHTEYSAPLQALLSLSNSESHNFTSEVLLRNAMGSWDSSNAQSSVHRWLKSIGLTSKNLKLADGSGLSRSNQTTTKLLSSLIYKMKSHKHFPYYYSSMSVIGLRGTLSEFEKTGALKGSFYGKTGTLDGVRSMTGYLDSNSGRKFISIIYNGHEPNSLKFSMILNVVRNYRKCRDY